MPPQFTLYDLDGPTPNPLKIMIMLEELGLEYAMVHKKMGCGENGMKAPDFLKINPNGRVPALVDHTNNDLVVWESGAILLYLAERFDTKRSLSGASVEERAEVWQWLMFQLSGLGPSQGQANWFIHFHDVKQPEMHPSVIERYQNETRRIYGVLERRLTETEWLALGRFTIVDIAYLPWLNIANIAQVDMDEFPKLKAYTARVKALPAAVKAYGKVKERHPKVNGHVKTNGV